jgi:hypothetical protein
MGRDMKKTALDYLGVGLSVIPTTKEKIPLCEWRPFQKQLASTQQVEKWSKKTYYLGIVTGKVSGNLETLDIDDQEAFVEWRNLISEEAPGLFEKLVIETTQNDHFHATYRCPEMEIPGNLKLAQRMNETELKTLIETRGEGGYFVCDPSPGYRLKQGDFANVPEITKEERETLISCAMALNEYVEPQRVVSGPTPGPKSTSELSPGEDFNERGDIKALLTKHGWEYVKTNGSYERWRRPGKENKRQYSASLIDGRTLYIFSSNAHPFVARGSYSPFAVYAYLEHEGDFSAAAKALAREGYGDKPQRKKKSAPALLGLDQLNGLFAEDVTWLWRNHLPVGMPVIIGGREGDGKTTTCIQIAKEILDEHPTGYIVWISSEGFVSDTKNKMEKLEVDRKRFLLLRNANETFQFNFNLPSDRNQLDDTLLACKEKGLNVLAVFIDSIRGITPFDDNESKIKNVMLPLNGIVCDKYGANLTYIDHHKKGQATTLLDKLSGTPAKSAAVRCVYAVVPAGGYVRKITCAKTNLLNHRPQELKSALSSHGLIIYETEQPDHNMKDEAQKFLIDLFAKETEYRSTEIYDLGEKYGYGTETLKKAKLDLGIGSKPQSVGQPWIWTCDKFIEE